MSIQSHDFFVPTFRKAVSQLYLHPIPPRVLLSGLDWLDSAGQTFPVSQPERQMLLAKMEPMTDKANEPRDDIRVPCTRIVTQLKKQVSKVQSPHCRASCSIRQALMCRPIR